MSACALPSGERKECVALVTHARNANYTGAGGAFTARSTRRVLLSSYTNAFEGRELVSWLLATRASTDRAAATALARSMQTLDLLVCVRKRGVFSDDAELYRFKQDVPPPRTRKELEAGDQSAQSMALGCDATTGWVSKKGKFKWNKRWFVLVAQASALYWYDSEFDRKPRNAIADLSRTLVSCTSPEDGSGGCKKGTFCFVLESVERRDVFACDTAAEMDLWMSSFIAAGARLQEDNVGEHTGAERSLFDFKAQPDIDDRERSLDEWRGKNYAELVTLYRRYRAAGFVILAFPCNQFGQQEPGSAAEIKAFAANLGAEWPLFARVKVNGRNACALYRFLRKSAPGTFGTSVAWNFTKFLCNRKGVPVARYGPHQSPLSFEKKIVELLNDNDDDDDNDNDDDDNNNNNNNDDDDNNSNNSNRYYYNSYNADADATADELASRANVLATDDDDDDNNNSNNDDNDDDDDDGDDR